MQVMAISVILISSDSSEESVGTSTAQVILFGMIPTTIPSNVPIVDSPTIPPIAPTIQYTSPFICNDSSDSDTSKRPSSQDPYEIFPAPPGLPHRPVVLVLPGQTIPVGRPYRTQPNGVLKMLKASKSVGPLPTHRLTLRYSTDYFSSNHFTSNDSSRDSLSDSLSETSFFEDYLFLGHSISDSPCDLPTAISAGPSHKKRRSLTTSVLLALPIPGALSPVCADLLPPRKRIRDSNFVTDFEVSSEECFVPHVPREIGLRVDVEDSYEPYTEPDIDPDVQADIDACIAFADDIAARGMDVRVEVGIAAEEEAESSTRGTTEIGVDRRGLDVVMQELYDYMVEILVHRVRVIESVQRDQGHRIVATSQQSAAIS
ncbi:hypothetical protein Tco_1245931 [Tanacetum coccineum]